MKIFKIGKAARHYFESLDKYNYSQFYFSAKVLFNRWKKNFMMPSVEIIKSVGKINSFDNKISVLV